jgi:hypothetical protein
MESEQPKIIARIVGGRFIRLASKSCAGTIFYSQLAAVVFISGTMALAVVWHLWW